MHWRIRRKIWLVCVFFVAPLFSGCASFPLLSSRSVTSFDLTPVAYSVKGKGEPVLCFIHGWSGNSTYWHNQVKSFRAQYAVVTLDLAGHGRSGATRQKYTMRAFAQDVKSVLDRINAERVILIGHSMGGTVALEAARVMPKRVIGIIGVETFHNIEARYTDEEFQYLFDFLKSNYVEGTRSLVYGMFPPTADRTLVEDIMRDMSSTREYVGLSAIEELFSTDKLQLAKEVSVPVVCVNADLWESVLEINKKWLPGYRLYVLKGLGHFPMREKPDLFNAELEQAIEYIKEYTKDEEGH